MNTTNSADELKKQGLYFECSPKPVDDDAGTAPESPRQSTPPTIRPRTAQACDKCRERKTKCSGEKPTCVRCQGRGLLCHYSARASRGSRTRTVSPPQQKKRERVHTVEPPADHAGIPVPSQQSVANSVNTYKPYPYPQPSKSYSPRFQNCFLDVPRSSYQSELENALLEASPVAQSLPLTSGFEYRQAGAGSSGQNQYPDCEARGGSRDSMAGPNAQWWDPSYGADNKSLSSNAVRGEGPMIDDTQLGGSELEPLPIAPRPSYAASSSLLNGSSAGPTGSSSFFNSRGPYVAGHDPASQPRHHEQDLRTPTSGKHDASWSTSGFMEPAHSYSTGSSHYTATSTTSWHPMGVPHQPAPQHPQHHYLSSQRHQAPFTYHSPIGILDHEDRRYSDYY